MRIKDFAESASATVSFIVEDQDDNLVWGIYPDINEAVSKDNYYLAQLDGEIVSWWITSAGVIWIKAELDRHTSSYTMPEISNIKECIEEFFEYAESCGVGALL